MGQLLLLLGPLILGACTSLPTAIQDAPPFDISYSQAEQNIGKFKNAPVRWGGVVVDVENGQSSTFVQVLYYPLGYFGQPQLTQAHGGRFAITTPEFLDPAVYAKGREITVAGTLTGDMARTIGKKTIRLPQVSASAIHLWTNYEGGRNYYPGYGAYGGLGYPYPGYFPNPYYWGGYYRPY
ncbi:MAG: hypothetical protein CTY16_07850 [Methylobacter sp.]|nr:MAG: hypothetical protein CTY16_07850 [Methylobacter sp.]